MSSLLKHPGLFQKDAFRTSKEHRKPFNQRQSPGGVKRLLSNTSQNSQENTCVKLLFFAKAAALPCNFITSGTLQKVFSCEFLKFFKNTFFEGRLWLLLLLYTTFIFDSSFPACNLQFY